MSDPHSLYRQVFNRDLDFFLFVIDNTPAPFHIKLHITTLYPDEVSSLDVVESVLKFI